MDKQQYMETQVKPIMENLIFQMICERPDDPVAFMIEWLKKTGGYTSISLTQVEKKELENMRKEVRKYRENNDPNNAAAASANSDDDDDDEYEVKPDTKPEKKLKKARTGISAEAYGKYNKKEVFVPRIIPKSDQQYLTIRSRILQSFLFQNLDSKDINIVVGAMEEKSVKAGAYVINQGDEGDCLFVVESGELDCYKVMNPEKSKQPTYLRTFIAGEAFGELALLYNAPRSASIKAKTNAVLWALDRDTFNNVVKDAAQMKRKKYEKFLKSVEILQTMDDYEISQISDALKTCTYKEGDFVIRQGEVGDVFYIIEEGEALAYITQEPGKPQIPEILYKKGGYFGELALLRDQPRAANVVAKTDLQLVTLDRKSFLRLLGPIDAILKRNADKYKKYVQK